MGQETSVMAALPEFHIFYQMLLMALAALFVDALLGSHVLLGRVPGPDSLIRMVLQWSINWSNRVPIHSVVKAVAGAGAVIIFTVLAALAGHWLDRFAESADGDGVYWQLFYILLLALMLGQRAVVDTARHLARRLEAPVSQQSEGRHAAARWTIERLAHRVSDGLIGNLFWLSLGGLAGLFAFRVLSIFVAIGSPGGVRQPRDPFYFFGGWVYWLAGLPSALIASLYLALAGTVVAPSRVVASLGFAAEAGLLNAIPLRLWPLKTLSELLDVALKAEPEAQGGDVEWIGASGGRARAKPSDVRKAMLTVVVTWLLVLLSLGALLLQVMS